MPTDMSAAAFVRRQETYRSPGRGYTSFYPTIAAIRQLLDEATEQRAVEAEELAHEH